MSDRVEWAVTYTLPGITREMREFVWADSETQCRIIFRGMHPAGVIVSVVRI